MSLLALLCLVFPCRLFVLPVVSASLYLFFFFFFNDTATTEIYTLSLHDALPICPDSARAACACAPARSACRPGRSEEHTSELQSHSDLVCRLLLEKKNRSVVGYAPMDACESPTRSDASRRQTAQLDGLRSCHVSV